MKHESVLIETVRVRRGEAPLWGLHLRRLFRSCAELGVPAPMELGVPGGGRDRVHRLAVGPKGVEVSERPVGPTAPVDLVTSAVVHHPYPHKTTSRDPFDRALAEAHRAGADDAILLTEAGRVTECAIWTLFWWGHTGELCTPALELGVLPGVARERIAELAVLAERKVERAALDGRPLFVANAARGIVEVGSLDGTRVPESSATEVLRAQFWG
jgi:branched-subunit amino acid aminotransferase/4-amino-4-deoxychorismate lyase